MSNFSLEDFHQLAKLCRIDCPQAEQEALMKSLARVLQYVEQLKEVPTEGVRTCSYVLRNMLNNKMREDTVADLLAREELLNNAPDQIGGMIRTPPVLKPTQ
jgi:aspartyl-tRNA(Asn)/glutamyl-tRNA(Gln) amidotransferase subunit C